MSRVLRPVHWLFVGVAVLLILVAIGIPRLSRFPQEAGRVLLVQPFADGEYWVVTEDLEWSVDETDLTITVPRGFVMDCASIPAPFRSAVSDVGRHGTSAVVHDFLYWDQGCMREQADELMMLKMEEDNVGPATRETIYRAVRVGGQSAWRRDAEERQRGEPRVIPDLYLPVPSGVDWELYRRTLIERGVTAGPRNGELPDYCEAATVLLGANSERRTWTLGVFVLGLGVLGILTSIAGLHFYWLYSILGLLRAIRDRLP